MIRILSTVFILLTPPIQASELIYTPQSPSFGGSPSTGAHLLTLANAQKQFHEEEDESTAIEDFNDRLQRSLLSRIASAVTRDIVGTDGTITPGFFETVDYTIEIVDEGDGTLSITTTDRVTGDTSVIQVQNNT